jgi:hypothetical protein
MADLSLGDKLWAMPRVIAAVKRPVYLRLRGRETSLWTPPFVHPAVVRLGRRGLQPGGRKVEAELIQSMIGLQVGAVGTSGVRRPFHREPRRSTRERLGWTDPVFPSTAFVDGEVKSAK